MMRLTRLIFLSVLASTFFIACNKDDDDTPEIPPRDQGEQAIADDEAIQAFLQTHFYNYDQFENARPGFDNVIRFDTIAGDNSDKTPLIESDLLTSKVITRNDVDYTVYVLTVREGAGESPTFADSTFVTYQGTLLNRNVFESNIIAPVWFDLPGYVSTDSQGRLTKIGGRLPGFMEIPGLREGLVEFREASGYTVNADNTIKWNDDYGIGAVFIPSGLGYFASSSNGIPPYSPVVFSFRLLRTVEADHDGDGIPSRLEDINGDRNLFNDDTDRNGFTNHSDADDDGDGTPTREEIIIHEDGTIEFPDTNGNGIPNYLDPEDFLPVQA